MTRAQLAVLYAAALFVLEQFELNRGDAERRKTIDAFMRSAGAGAGVRWYDTLRRITGDISRELAERDFVKTKRAAARAGGRR